MLYFLAHLWGRWVGTVSPCRLAGPELLWPASASWGVCHLAHRYIQFYHLLFFRFVSASVDLNFFSVLLLSLKSIKIGYFMWKAAVFCRPLSQPRLLTRTAPLWSEEFLYFMSSVCSGLFTFLLSVLLSTNCFNFGVSYSESNPAFVSVLKRAFSYFHFLIIFFKKSICQVFLLLI